MTDVSVIDFWLWSVGQLSLKINIILGFRNLIVGFEVIDETDGTNQPVI